MPWVVFGHISYVVEVQKTGAGMMYVKFRALAPSGRAVRELEEGGYHRGCWSSSHFQCHFLKDLRQS